jgi:outer membrane biosynthesis protein TonB
MQMRTASVISTGLHAAVLLFAVVTFTGKSLESTPVEALPVDMISEKEFSEMTKGVKDAPKPLDKPKPLVEKIDTPKPVEAPVPKVTEKKEITPTAEKPPEPKPPEPKKEAKAEPPKPAPPKEEPKTDAIAEKLAKPEEPKKEAKSEPLPPKKPEIKPPEKKQPKFDPNKIAALLDKRDPQRNAATGAALSNAPSMGTATGMAAQLSQSEIDALRARLMALWNPPIGAQGADGVQITIRIRFKRDGTLEIGPQVLTSGSGGQFIAMRDSAVRAVLVGQPYTMLRPDHYETWKEIDFTFDTKEMFHDIPVRRPL